MQRPRAESLRAGGRRQRVAAGLAAGGGATPCVLLLPRCHQRLLLMLLPSSWDPRHRRSSSSLQRAAACSVGRQRRKAPDACNRHINLSTRQPPRALTQSACAGPRVEPAQPLGGLLVLVVRHGGPLPLGQAFRIAGPRPDTCCCVTATMGWRAGKGWAWRGYGDQRLLALAEVNEARACRQDATCRGPPPALPSQRSVPVWSGPRCWVRRLTALACQS